MNPNPYACQPGSTLQTTLRDRTTGNTVPITIQNLDLYRFFLRVHIDELKPHYTEATTITNIGHNWQILTEPPLNVVGVSTDGAFFLFYVETEEQTLARIKHL